MIDADIGAEVGDGPVYLYSVQSIVFFRPTQSSDEQGWVAGELWFLIKPGVEGAVLVRGHQVDGPNEVRFGEGDAPDPELVFKAPAQARLPTTSRIPGPSSSPTCACVKLAAMPCR